MKRTEKLVPFITKEWHDDGQVYAHSRAYYIQNSAKDRAIDEIGLRPPWPWSKAPFEVTTTEVESARTRETTGSR